MSSQPRFFTMPSWQRMRRPVQLLGVGLLIWILAQLDIGRVMATLAATDVSYLILYVALFVTAMVLRVLRLRGVLAYQGFSVGFAVSYLVTMEAALLGSVTPARAGEVSKIFTLRHAGVRTKRGVLVVLLERVFDLATFVMLAIGSVFYFAEYFVPIGRALFIVATALGMVGMILLYIWRAKWIGLFEKALDRIGNKWSGGTRFLKKGDIDRGLKVFFGVWKSMFAYSCLIGAIGAIEVYCLARALSIEVDFSHVVFSYSVASLIALAPVSFNGLGTREAAYIYLLGLSAVGTEQATLLSLLDGLVLPLLMIAILSIPLVRSIRRTPDSLARQNGVREDE